MMEQGSPSRQLHLPHVPPPRGKGMEGEEGKKADSRERLQRCRLSGLCLSPSRYDGVLAQCASGCYQLCNSLLSATSWALLMLVYYWVKGAHP